MWSNIPSILVAALAVIPVSLATPYPAPGPCKYKCSSNQIDTAFKTPQYLKNTKEFCRQYLRLPVSSVVTKTKTVNIPVYSTRTTLKTKTGAPVTITRTNTRFTTVVNQATSLTTDTDVSTVSSTSTILVVSTSDVTETEYVIATSNVIATITVTTTETATATDTQAVVVTSYTPDTGTKKMKRMDDMNANEIHIFKRAGKSQYSYAFKIPAYLPQDLTPQQISWACKRLNPCSTRTTTITKSIKIPQTKTITKYSTVIPTVSKTITVIKTIPTTNTIQQTVVTTIFYTTVTSVTVTAQTVTETIATETQTTATITTVAETDTATETISETQTQTVTQTSTQVLACSTGIAGCSLDHPESCCSGRCVKWFSSPNCCVSGGQPCDIAHPEGCCGGTCAYDHTNSDNVRIYNCLGG
ncbi:hypothetical protein TWF730_008281 [Orbilia blumenaviensis]|uniref:Uncharacterized protein n=1 Tax=Orbilia blumenaviensis TaxID=1796055 RepID=A0AAV9V513_9PEZI